MNTIRLFVERHLLLFLFLFALFLRLPLLHTEFFRTPDAFEYLNVAENIVNGNGFTQSIKRDFFTNDPVVTSALKGRPVFTSFVFAGILWIFRSVYAIQAMLLLIGAINVLLFYKLARTFLSSSSAFLAGVALALNPNLLITNRLILSEPIFLSLALLFFIVFYQKSAKRNYFLLGILAALAFLTRFEGALLLVTALLFKRKQGLYALYLIMAGFLIPTLPYFIANAIVNHSPFYSYNVFHLQVHHFADGMWNGFGKVFPTKEQFIKQNFFWIILADSKIFLYNFTSIISFGFLGIFSLIYLFQSLHLGKKFTPFLLFFALFFIILSVVWSAFQEPERHFSIIFPFLLIPVFYVFEKPAWKRLGNLFLIIMLCAYTILSVHRLYWAKFVEPVLDNHGLTNKQETYQWISAHTSKTSIIAATDPWAAYWFTKRPAVMLPANTNVLNSFTKDYHVSFIISDKKIQNNDIVLTYTSPNVFLYKVVR